MVTFAELAVEAGRMAMLLRDEAAQVELRRMALSRSALVWWQGEAAAGYQRRVLERGAALAATSQRLTTAAAAWEALEREADDAALAEAGWVVPP